MLQYRELQNGYTVLPAVLDAGLRCKGTCTASPTPFQTLALLRPPLQPQQDRARPVIHRILSTTALRRLECLSCRMLLRHSRHNLVCRGSAVLRNGTLQVWMLLERERLGVASSEGLFGLYIYILWTVCAILLFEHYGLFRLLEFRFFMIVVLYLSFVFMDTTDVNLICLWVP